MKESIIKIKIKIKKKIEKLPDIGKSGPDSESQSPVKVIQQRKNTSNESEPSINIIKVVGDIKNISPKNNENKGKISEFLKYVNKNNINLGLGNKQNEDKYNQKEILNAHKMLILMNNIEKEENESVNQTDILDFKKNVNISEEIKENYIDNNAIEINNNNQVDVSKSNIIKENIDYSDLDEEIKDIKNKIGEFLFDLIYLIVNENVPENSITYDKKNISILIIQKLTKMKTDRILVNLSIEKLPEIFALIIKEREVKKKQKLK